MSKIIEFDILIIGAGPAGVLAAAGAKKKNKKLKIGIIAPNDGKYRVGEALLTGTIYTLYDAGLIGAVSKYNWHRKIGATYIWGKDKTPWSVSYSQTGISEDYPLNMQDSSSRFTIHVPRDKFDSAILNELLLLYPDIQIINERVSAVETSGKKNKHVHSVKLKNGTLVTSKFYIDASGQSSILGRNVTDRKQILTNRISSYGYLKDIDWKIAERNGFDKNRTNIVSNENGWGWVIHLGEEGRNLTSVGFVSTREIIQKINPQNYLSTFEHLKLFGINNESKFYSHDGKEILKSFYGHPDYSYKCENLEGHNWSLCGDAALFLDPILSQGVTLATHYGFMRGIAAAEHLAGNIDSNKHVTQHYLNEASVLAEVVNYWYENNKQAKDWKNLAEDISEHLGFDDPEKPAFMWLTNLENVRLQYKVYSDSEQIKINNALGIDKEYLISK